MASAGSRPPVMQPVFSKPDKTGRRRPKGNFDFRGDDVRGDVVLLATAYLSALACVLLGATASIPVAIAAMLGVSAFFVFAWLTK